MIDLFNYIFWPPLIFTTKAVPQLWRLFTSFWITHPKLGIIMDPYFLYQYGSGLETESSRFPNPGDFFVYTMFVGSVIVVSCSVGRSSSPILLLYVSTTSDYLPAQPIF
jgi:Derlin-2/3